MNKVISIQGGAAAGVYRWHAHHGILVVFTQNGPLYWESDKIRVKGGNSRDRRIGNDTLPCDELKLTQSDRRRKATISVSGRDATAIPVASLTVQLHVPQYRQHMVRLLSTICDRFEQEYFGVKALPVQSRVCAGLENFLAIAGSVSKELVDEALAESPPDWATVHNSCSDRNRALASMTNTTFEDEEDEQVKKDEEDEEDEEVEKDEEDEEKKKEDELD